MIHDVDKGNPDRGTPRPNAHDLQGLRMAHGTNSVNYVTDASPATVGPLILGGNDRLVKSAVVTHTVPIVAAGSIATTTTTTPHGLGYAPSVRAALNDASIGGGSAYNVPLPAPISIGANTGGVGGAPNYLAMTLYMEYAVDGTNFYVITFGTDILTPLTYQVTFYLYQQTAR